MLDFKAIEVTENIKYVQLLWVTKDLQSVIKGGADDRKQAQIHTLEKQMDHSQKLSHLQFFLGKHLLQVKNFINKESISRVLLAK